MAPAKPSPEVDSSPSSEANVSTMRPRRRRLLIAAGGVVATAIVAALASAVITPERIDALFGHTSEPSSPAEVVFKRVVSSDGVFTLDLPESWLSSGAVYNVAYDGTTDAGTAMTAGDDPLDGRQPTEDGIYLGVSVDAAQRFHLGSTDAAELQDWVDAAALRSDWSIDGCVRGASQLSGPDGWVNGVVAWDDCYSTKGIRIWEIYAVPPGGAFVLYLQPQLSAKTDEAVLAHIIASLVVDSSKIP
ncbi:MAG: hypothetical protein ABL886_13285 [Rhodoglobus sp.]